MTDILIVYGTAYGQTERIVQRIAQRLGEQGHRVSVRRADQPQPLPVEEYGAVVVAASVLFGKHQRSVRDFVRRRLSRLQAVPAAFVSVSGAAAGSSPESCKQAQGYVQDFLRQTGWRPGVTQTFAGGVPYTRYGPFRRWMMKMISRRTGGPTDTSRDYEFTDWDAVDRFAAELARTVSVTAGGPAP
ncbi:MAG TPA: flavodoxin domain-containing protein [Gemmatimonadales bacterium]|nr:flavodoxin domain-containing protein [Gemmatimonadales bacterium]